MDDNTSAFIRPSTATRDVVMGATASATAPFYLDIGSPSSSLQIGRSGNANLFVGTSTYGGGLDSLFVMNGDDTFIQGNLGVASSVYTNGGFSARSGTSSTYYGGNLVSTNGSELVLEQTGDSLGSTRFRLQSRFGSTGAVFEQGSSSLALVDFGFRLPTTQSNLRLEGRNGSTILGQGNEFQFLMNATDTTTYIQFAVASSGAAFMVPVAVNATSGSFALSVNGSVGPTSGNTSDLGSSTTSWRNVYASGTLAFVNATGTSVSTTNLYVNSRFYGAGLSATTDCSGIDQKLTWSSSTGQFTCRTDIVGNTKTASATATVTLTPANSQVRLTTVTTTPSNVGSEILVAFSVQANNAAAQRRDITVQIWRGSTNACGAGTKVGNDTVNNLTNVATNRVVISGSFIDAPGTTAATGYTVCAASSNITTTAPNVTNRSITTQEVNVGADVAEVYYSTEEITPGDVVSTDLLNDEQVVMATPESSHRIIGVVATRPGLVMSDGKLREGKPALIALAGRVPVKVSLENGDIAIGDALTPSSIPGHLMKATQDSIMVGRALSALKQENGGTTGKVMMFVQNGYYLKNVSQPSLASSPSSTAAAQPTGSITQVSYTVTPQGLNSLHLESLQVVDAEFSGNVVVTGSLVLKGAVIFGSSNAGRVQAMPGESSIKVVFASSTAFAPHVYLSPELIDRSNGLGYDHSIWNGAYYLTNVSNTGFEIRLPQGGICATLSPCPVELWFNWFIVGFEGEGGQPALPASPISPPPVPVTEGVQTPIPVQEPIATSTGASTGTTSTEPALGQDPAPLEAAIGSSTTTDPAPEAQDLVLPSQDPAPEPVAPAIPDPLPEPTPAQPSTPEPAPAPSAPPVLGE